MANFAPLTLDIKIIVANRPARWRVRLLSLVAWLLDIQLDVRLKVRSR